MVQQQSFKTACSYINTTSFFLSFFFQNRLFKRWLIPIQKKIKNKVKGKSTKPGRQGNVGAAHFCSARIRRHFYNPYHIVFWFHVYVQLDTDGSSLFDRPCVCQQNPIFLERSQENYWSSLCQQHRLFLARRQENYWSSFVPTTLTIFSEESGKLLAIFMPTKLLICIETLGRLWTGTFN